MSIKLKALGLGLIATMAMGAFAAVNASAIVSGHFTSVEQDEVVVKGVETGFSDRLKFRRTNANTVTLNEEAIVCDKASYSGLVNEADTTTQDVTVAPSYSECHTESGAPGSVQVAVNGCTYTFFSRTQGTGHGTVNVVCPAGKAIVIQHPSCEITVPAQSATGGAHMKQGVTYTTTQEGPVGQVKHALTMNVTVTHITGQFHGGLCVFLGTNQLFEMTGAVLVWGETTGGVRTDITHT